MYLSDARVSKFSKLFRTVDIDIATVSNNNSNISAFELQEGISKVRVYLWVEGQDVDCENNASIGDIVFDLQFTTNPS